MMAIRPIRIEGDIAFVPLTRGYESIIDAADAPLVGRFNWQVRVAGHSRTFYAVRVRRAGERPRSEPLHRLVLTAPDGLEVDHINGNGLDNRRCNLRLATSAENKRNCGLRRDNKSGFKGVCFDKVRGKWVAQIRNGQKRERFYYFETPEAAYEAYCEAAVRLHGEFARLSA